MFQVFVISPFVNGGEALIDEYSDQSRAIAHCNRLVTAGLTADMRVYDDAA